MGKDLIREIFEVKETLGGRIKIVYLEELRHGDGQAHDARAWTSG